MELSCAGIVLAFCILIKSVHTHIKVCIHILCMWYIQVCSRSEDRAGHRMSSLSLIILSSSSCLDIGSR